MARAERLRQLYKLILIGGLALGLMAARTAHAAEIVHVVGPGENLFRIGYLVRLQGHVGHTDIEKPGEAFSICKNPRFDFPDSDAED